MHQEKITSSLLLLQNYIEDNNYKGYDPYDGLTSPYFNAPILRSNKLIRFGTQQLVKRFPFNLRPLLRIPKGYNPVTLGLCIQGYAYLSKVYPEKNDFYIAKILYLVTELEKMIPKGFSGACWGYDFDWEARHAKIPAYQPTVVATGIITNALFICYNLTGIQKAADLCISSADFVMKDLNRTYDNNTFIFSYSPFDKQKVFNASMKGIRILAQVYSLTKKEELRITSKKAVDYIINRQNEDGSWYYSESNAGKWVDNYHTGYIIDCFDDFIKFTGIRCYEENLKKGFEYYCNNFFLENGFPKFYAHKTYPLDCTSAAQSILTLTRFQNIESAHKVAEYLINNMHDGNAFFYFRKFKNYTIKTSFMRWSNAWMFAGFSYLIYKSNGNE